MRDPKVNCKTTECKEIALYGTSRKPKHCEKHKEKGEVNLIEKECKKCHMQWILNADELCYTCDPVNGINFVLAKQNAVKAYFDQHNFKYILYDKRVDNGICINDRPDFLFDYLTHYVIVDEHQHDDRLCECEIKRMINISQALGTTDNLH